MQATLSVCSRVCREVITPQMAFHYFLRNMVQDREEVQRNNIRPSMLSVLNSPRAARGYQLFTLASRIGYLHHALTSAAVSVDATASWQLIRL